MLKFIVEPKDKTIDLMLMLKGEVEPLQVTMREFDCFIEDGKGFIHAKEISTSREWLNILLGHVFKDNQFEVPQDIVKILSVIK